MLKASTEERDAETVSRERARTLLGVGNRRFRDLVQAGRLLQVGSGQRKRITAASLAAELRRRRKKRQSGRGKSGNPEDSSGELPFFSPGAVDEKTKGPQNVSMTRKESPPAAEAANPVAELVSLARAAALVGVGEETFRRAVVAGQVPVVRVGYRWRVNLNVLRDWSKGQTQN